MFNVFSISQWCLGWYCPDGFNTTKPILTSIFISILYKLNHFVHFIWTGRTLRLTPWIFTTWYTVYNFWIWYTAPELLSLSYWQCFDINVCIIKITNFQHNSLLSISCCCIWLPMGCFLSSILLAPYMNWTMTKLNCTVMSLIFSSMKMLNLL